MNELLKTNRFGTFKLSRHFLERLSKEQVDLIFQGMFITRCEYNFASDTFEYIAFSEKFKRVPEGSEPYEYTPIVITKQSEWRNSVYVEFEEI